MGLTFAQLVVGHHTVTTASRPPVHPILVSSTKVKVVSTGIRTQAPHMVVLGNAFDEARLSIRWVVPSFVSIGYIFGRESLPIPSSELETR